MIPLRRPEPGTFAAIVAPSAPGWRLSRQAEKRASRLLAKLGLIARPASGMRARSAKLAVDVSLRLKDIKDALEDPEVGAIFAVYGGYNCIDLLFALPYELWKTTRKPLIGFSDVTALSAALWTQTGLPSLHGPNFATLGAPDPHAFTSDSLEAALFQPQVELRDPEIIAQDLWFQTPTARIRDWSLNSWLSVRGGRCTGRLLGGNLPTLLALAGTRYFPDLRGSVLLIECDVDNPPFAIDRDLAQLGLIGAYKQAVGILLGSLGRDNDGLIPRLIAKHLRDFPGPILARVNCSHVDPIATLPHGGVVTLDADERTLSFASPFG